MSNTLYITKDIKDLGIFINKQIYQRYKDKIHSLYREYSDKFSTKQFILFCAENLDFDIDINLPVLALTDMKYFFGHVVVMTNNQMLVCENLPNANVCCYIDHPIWMDSTTTMFYHSIKRLYNNTNFSFLTPDRLTYELYKNLWGNNITIGDLTYDNIIQQTQ